MWKRRSRNIYKHSGKLAEHYKRSFGAKQIASISSGGPKRFMLADEDAWKVFSKYLVVEEAV